MLKFTVFRPTDKKNEINNSNALLRQFLHTNELVKNLFVNDDFCRRAVKEIDKSEIVSENLIISPYLGSIGPESLSGSVSTILSIYFLCKNNNFDFYFNSSYVGDRCIPFLLEIAVKYDIIMWVTYPLKITDMIFKEYLDCIYSIDEKCFINAESDFKRIYQKWTYELILKEEAEEEVDEELEALEREVTKQQLKDCFDRWRSSKK